MKGFTSDDVLGKWALDPEGAILGVVVKLHVDPAKKIFLGVTIDQGFLKPDLYVGIDHVKRFGVDAVFLAIVPYEDLKGKVVMNSRGEQLGVVRKTLMNGHRLDTITIARKVGTFKKDELFDVKASDVKEIGEAVILRKKASKEGELKESS